MANSSDLELKAMILVIADQVGLGNRLGQLVPKKIEELEKLEEAEKAAKKAAKKSTKDKDD